MFRGSDVGRGKELKITGTECLCQRCSEKGRHRSETNTISPTSCLDTCLLA